jgi:hypothetical protein
VTGRHRRNGEQEEAVSPPVRQLVVLRRCGTSVFVPGSRTPCLGGGSRRAGGRRQWGPSNSTQEDGAKMRQAPLRLRDSALGERALGP